MVAAGDCHDISTKSVQLSRPKSLLPRMHTSARVQHFSWCHSIRPRPETSSSQHILGLKVGAENNHHGRNAMHAHMETPGWWKRIDCVRQDFGRDVGRNAGPFTFAAATASLRTQATPT